MLVIHLAHDAAVTRDQPISIQACSITYDLYEGSI